MAAAGAPSAPRPRRTLQVATCYKARAASFESVECVDRIEVERDTDQGVAIGSPALSLPSRVVDQASNALVARPRNIEMCSIFPASAVRLGDRDREIVEANDDLHEAVVESRS